MRNYDTSENVINFPMQRKERQTQPGRLHHSHIPPSLHPSIPPPLLPSLPALLPTSIRSTVERHHQIRLRRRPSSMPQHPIMVQQIALLHGHPPAFLPALLPTLEPFKRHAESGEGRELGTEERDLQS